MNNDDEDEKTNEDIIIMVTKEETLEEEEELPKNQINVIPHSEGFKKLDGALEYISQQEGTSTAEIKCLRKLRDMAGRQRSKTVKQKYIEDFFKTNFFKLRKHFCSIRKYKFMYTQLEFRKQQKSKIS